jgi:hypothetical protein
MDEERLVSKILIRQANPDLYSCQVWFEGEREPESFFLHLDD